MVSLLTPLDRKVLRDLRRTWGQALAIAMVIGAGIALFVMFNGMLRSLEETRRAYYERYRFAEIFAPVKRAPDRVVQDIRSWPGVRIAEGRISAGVLIDLPTFKQPIVGHAVSLPDIGEAALNRIVLREGRMLEPFREDEILISEKFAEAHGLKPGDTLSATMNGAKRAFQIVGIALSPEYIYTIAPGSFVPDPRRFGVIWMGREALGAAFDLDGAFNSLVLTLSPDANRRDVIERLDRGLKRYGATGAFDRDDQISHKFVSSELDQLSTIGAILPPIFLGVAAFLLNVVVGRLIDTEREQIGLLKAFGYSNFQVALHYTKYVMAMSVVGTAGGCFVGAWLGRGMTQLYQQFFNFPFLIFDAGADTFAIAVLVSFGAALFGVFVTVRRAIVLSPAVAMRPPAPPDYSRIGHTPRIISRLIDQPTRMIFRRIARGPIRSSFAILGVAAATGIMIAGRFNLDAVETMLDVNFNVSDRQDITVGFAEPQGLQTIFELKSMPGVIAVEPFRSVPVRMKNGRIQSREALTGLSAGSDLSRPIGADLNRLTLPERGVLLSVALAKKIKAGVGDVLEIDVLEGRQPTILLEVTGIAETYVGAPAYMRIEAINTVLREGARVSGAYLQIDDAYRDRIYDDLKSMPLVASVTLRAETLKAFQDLLNQNLGTVTLINIIFSSLIAIGVVYNGARLALSERARELASLRVLGFTKGEASYILLGEVILLTLIALPIGSGFGYLLCWYLAESFSSDLYRIPLSISMGTYGYSVLVVVIASVVSGYLVNRDISKLDLVAVLKTRE